MSREERHSSHAFDIRANVELQLLLLKYDMWSSKQQVQSLIIVNPLLLSKSSGNKAILVPLNRTIRSMFDLEDPFATHRLNTLWTRNNIPSIILLKCLKFLCHGLSPLGVLNRLPIRTRLTSSMYGGKKAWNYSEKDMILAKSNWSRGPYNQG